MGKHIKTGVIGHPIKHSKSPLIHNYWIEKYNLKGTYQAIDISPENLQDDIQKLINEGYAGFNVTIPHKEALIALCAESSPNVHSIGAANTIIIKNDQLHGRNTDGYGFIKNILDVSPKFDFKGKNAVILGAGGAARSIINALIGEQIKHVYLLNRTREKAETIQKQMKCSVDLMSVKDWDKRNEILSEADILINTTALGMEGQHALEIDLSTLAQTALVNDIVYAPLHTDLLKNAQSRGNTIITGIGMLIHQARPAFKEWFGIMPDVTDELRELVLK